MGKIIVYLYVSLILILVGIAVYYGVSGDGNFFKESIDNYLEFIYNFEDISLVSEGIKLIFLISLFALFYSSMNYLGFKKNTLIKVVFSVLLSFLASILLTQDEVLSIVLAYKALGITLIFFFPFFCLMFFSYISVIKFNLFGIVIQKILWWVYSIFLLVYTGGLLMFKLDIIKPQNIFLQKTYNLLLNLIISDSQIGISEIGVFASIILFLLSVVVFWIFAVRNSNIIKLYKSLSEQERANWEKLKKRMSNVREVADVEEVLDTG